jgi:hypothetical protein
MAQIRSVVLFPAEALEHEAKKNARRRHETTPNRILTGLARSNLIC